MIARTHWIRSALIVFCCTMTVGCGPASIETTKSTIDPSLQNTEPDPSTAVSTDSSHADFYTVSTYDESRDPNDDLAETIARAEVENKRVILQVGGAWCGWCSRITNYMSTNATVRSHLDKNFLVMKVTFPGEHADDFLAMYPKCDAYPHLFVLEKNGDLLHSQGTGELEEGTGYDQDVFMAFLTKWTP